MKNLKLLPLVAMISGVLVGCGGGGGGGGGGGTPTTTYTFTFVTPVTKNLSDNGTCTIFDKYQENSIDKVLNYHSVGTSLDSKIVGFYSDASGIQQGNLINATSGKLSLVLQTIPDDGFFTIQEANGTVINAITFSKAALTSDNRMATAYLSVESIVNDSLCLTGNNDATTTKSVLEYLNADDTTGNPDVTYYFDSQVETVTGTNPKLTSGKTLKALSGEQTMVAQYRTAERSQLFQYGFEGWSENRMKFAGSSSTPSFNASLINFSNIEIFSNYKSYQYLLATVNRGDDYYHPTETNGDTWSFKVNGTIAAVGWDATYFDTINTDWELVVDDNSLFMLSNTNNAKPSVSNQTIDISSSIGLSNEVGLQRLSYQQGTTVGTTPYVLRHTLYTLITPSVRVPNLNYDSVPPAAAAGLVISSASNISQDYLLAEEQDDLSLKGFMSGFGNGKGLDTSEDVMGIAANLKDVRSAYNTISTTRSLLLSRDD
ncbi:flagellar sheath protein A [Vibrio navarrensis]|uniref:flagellar sheath protein A n=1 Tax=Vibrio navarrensis TaxID=29495 RepID=UPI0018697C1C|nr:flagellar sheath protein A [Vibrio navarrensis]EJK2115576.1 flagellar sheath protein A [Vibrio navarrensis]MBE4577712.1 flagellar sheath protein A [Vibrio navarrensis]MBE4587894.1 flagellar sheath protein A [Vibrio navarrensis]MBE4597689.1 flagellar sheath protein A [Vibrio navarrensis]